jgi:CubicO group peptidase (beta-lactamase class C family)
VKRVMALAAIVFVLVASALWLGYLEPKVTLFEPAKVAINFRQMERAFPTRRIPASSQPRPLVETTLVPAYDLAPELPAFLERSRTTSFLVLHQGNLAHESYYQGYDAESRATSFSVAKSFVSALVGIALQEGAISSLDDPVERYRPELGSGGFAGVTIRHLLQMSSGIAFSEHYDDPRSDFSLINRRVYAQLQPVDRVAASFEAAEPPGQTFNYASINTHVLAMVLEAATGKSLAEYLSDKLWEPLGATAEASWVTDLYGQEIGFWGLNARPRDFARLGLLYLQEGMWDGVEVVPASWIEESTRADRPFLQRGQIEGDWGYQYQWWLPRGDEDDFAAIGIWGQFIYVNRDRDLVVVKTSADPDYKRHEFEAIQLFRRLVLPSGPSSTTDVVLRH